MAVAAYFVGQYTDGTLVELAGRHVGLAPTYAHRPWPVRAAFYAHIGCSGLALCLGPLQFSRRLRTRRPSVHRWVGRVYLCGVALGALGAFVISMFSSIAFNGFFGFGTLAVLWAWTAWRAYRAVAFSRDFPSHQAWMIRNFSLTYAAVTLRLWQNGLILLQLPFSDANLGTISDTAYQALPFWCWLPNIAVAELMIRRRGLPALRLSPPTPAALSGSPGRPAVHRDRV
ncbi:DUF2306 domain-containing protein [Pseudonocardia acaciae]|uniref:DUF2306 domain-containing protein n=1 Tax=Pseudonocardia acaciae TaxID=551276 RepID=UPI0007E8D1FD|nr:DUF2306 domain-containing protein [Pseudonocardia acaciae]